MTSANLTRRERQIVGALLTGATNREIASRLRLQLQTVKNHLTVAYAKLGVRTRLELAVRVGQPRGAAGHPAAPQGRPAPPVGE